MNARFLALFAATITLVMLSVAAGRSALAGGGTLAAIAFVLLVAPAVLGLWALVRVTYLDGVATGRTREGGEAR